MPISSSWAKNTTELHTPESLTGPRAAHSDALSRAAVAEASQPEDLLLGAELIAEVIVVDLETPAQAEPLRQGKRPDESSGGKAPGGCRRTPERRRAAYRR